MGTMNAPDPLVQRLRRGRRFLITSHTSPDGDAIGSSLALARLLRRLGKAAWVWTADEVPEAYRCLPGADRIHTGSEAPAGFPQDFDAAIVLECPSPERTGLAAALSGLPLLNVDHHLGNGLYGQLNWVDTSAPAVGEMVHRLAIDLHAPFDSEAADLLFLALASDTGGFRFSNTSAAAFDAAAGLVRLGASPERVSQWLYESQPLASVRLLGEMLGTVALHRDGRIATVVLTAEMFARAGATNGHSEGLIDHPRAIAGVAATALFKEIGGGHWKVSLRSRGSLDVERVASARGGGGHRNAAGFTASGDLAPLRDAVVADLAAALEAAGA